jgi:peptidoglycan/xylan/chitin deacetylase (PgdA/CDA1 family)
MRPPFGYINRRVQQVLTDMGYKIFIWNLDTSDWTYDQTNSGMILRNVQMKLKSQSHSYIVLQHDSLIGTVQTQQKLINFIKSKNFNITTLNKCINEVDSIPYAFNL